MKTLRVFLRGGGSFDIDRVSTWETKRNNSTQTLTEFQWETVTRYGGRSKRVAYLRVDAIDAIVEL